MGRVPSDEKFPDDMSAEGAKANVQYRNVHVPVRERDRDGSGRRRHCSSLPAKVQSEKLLCGPAVFPRILRSRSTPRVKCYLKLCL